MSKEITVSTPIKKVATADLIPYANNGRVHSDKGFIIGKKQEERYATWEPSIDRPPSFRPDLVLLPYSG